MNALPGWLELHRGDAPLIISFPHTGTELPEDVADQFVSPWLARRDTDWWIHQLYDFAQSLGATTLRTAISRSVIDVNRDPSGASLYPGQNTTGLCPLTTFDNQPLYADGAAPDQAQIALRRTRWFDPYHAALAEEIARLRAQHAKIVVYDAHSIRSFIPHLFDGELPQFNIGSNEDRSCDRRLVDAVERLCRSSGSSGAQRAFQGRLDHPPLCAARARRAHLADGTGLPRLHARAGQPDSRKLANAVAAGTRRGAARSPAPRAAGLPALRQCALFRHRANCGQPLIARNLA